MIRIKRGKYSLSSMQISDLLRQKLSQFPSNKFPSRFLITFIPLILFIGGTLTILFLSESHSHEIVSKLLEKSSVELGGKTIRAELKSVISDLMVLAQHHELKIFLREGIETQKRALEDELLAFSHGKAIYDQVRLLDQTGAEVIRIDNEGDSARVVIPSRLQNKSHRYYFTETTRLPPGGVFISPFDLNVEDNAIEYPIKPVIRFGTPVFDEKGQKRGVLILNYLGVNLLQSIKQDPQGAFCDLLLLNSDGYWLKGMTAEEEWGFMYADRMSSTLAQTDPELWQTISQSAAGQFMWQDNLVTFTTVYPLASFGSSITETTDPAAIEQIDKESNSYHWKIVTQLPKNAQRSEMLPLLNMLLVVFTILTIIGAVGNWFYTLNALEKKEAEAALQKAHDELEIRVQDRSKKLRQARDEMSERLKELRCMYGVTHSIHEFDNVNDILYRVVELIPPGWQYPEITRGKITFDGMEYLSEPFQETEWKQSSDITVHHIHRGTVEVYYLEARPDLADGPFLEEERNLLEGIANTLAESMERREAEEALRKSEERLRTFLKNAPVILFAIDSDGNFTLSEGSGLKALGLKPGEIVGTSVFDLYRDTPQILADVKRAQTGEEFTSVVDVAGLVFETKYLPLHDESGEFNGIIGVSSDITEKRKMEARSLRAQRMESLGTLASGIAHDLNNVLSPILMSIQLLKTQSDGERSLRVLRGLEENTQRGAAIIRQVLTFARGVEGEKHDLHPKSIVKEIEAIVRETFPKNIVLQTHISEDLLQVNADPTQLHQVLLNLCVNARDAMPDGGTIKVQVENLSLSRKEVAAYPGSEAGQYVCLQVSDTGVGIPESKLNRIFEPFYTTKEIGKGTGLGLSTVHTIVNNHNGFVNVYSEENKGTSFKVYLPASDVDEAKLSQIRPQDVLLGNGELILVVDDEVLIREIVKEALELSGYDVITANDGSDAIALYREKKDAVTTVIVDMNMPIMDGPATITSLRDMNPDVKVIATSGLPSSMAAGGDKEISAQAFLQKPYSADLLLETVARVLSPSVIV